MGEGFGRRWVLREEVDQDVVQRLQKELKVNYHIATLLGQRGIDTFKRAKEFFRPARAFLHTPFLMADMRRAVSRIKCAIDNNERIMVYGDYDVDGTTAVALVYSFFYRRYTNMEYYIPDRYTEGYGLTQKGLDTAYEHGCALVICLDCGIKSVKKIAYAKTLGIDVIVCDHHHPGEVLPEAFAVLNPKRLDCTYPYKELSGCGVGFKLLQAFAEAYKIDQEEVFAYIDLVAVSIASDVVAMDGENRVLASLGMRKFKEDPLLGLYYLQRISGIEDVRKMENILFKIGPRINAAGRIASGAYAVELLTTDDKQKAYKFSGKIDDYNTERRAVDELMTQQALQKLACNKEEELRKTTVLFDPTWHKGVVGIVASRLLDYYYRPTIVLTESNGRATGSARSVEGFDLYSAIEACSDLLINFGGHTYAAGLSMSLDNVEAFRRKFEEVVEERLTEEMSIPKIYIDTEIKLREITLRFCKILKQFQPFGPQNPAPVFCARRVRSVKGSVRRMGKSSEHMRFEVYSETDPSYILSAVAYQQSDKYGMVYAGDPIDICFTVDEITIQGQAGVQLHIKDIRPS